MNTDRNGFVRCRVCGCTEIDACPGGCGWVPGEENLCTTCGEAARAILIWRGSARRANIAALLREARTLPPMPRKLLRHLREEAAKGGGAK